MSVAWKRLGFPCKRCGEWECLRSLLASNGPFRVTSPGQPLIRFSSTEDVRTAVQYSPVPLGWESQANPKVILNEAEWSGELCQRTHSCQPNPAPAAVLKIAGRSCTPSRITDCGIISPLFHHWIDPWRTQTRGGGIIPKGYGMARSTCRPSYFSDLQSEPNNPLCVPPYFVSTEFLGPLKLGYDETRWAIYLGC